MSGRLGRRSFLPNPLILLYFLSLAHSQPDDKPALLRFKNSIKSDPSGILSTWFPNSDPCSSWSGITCNSHSKVTSLVLPTPGNLTGNLHPLGNLTDLKQLSLPSNSFSGKIPAEIWNLDKLEELNLEGNLLTGHLPLKFSLQSLKILNLGSNYLEGGIPLSLSNSPNLQTLILSRNRFTGKIPGFLGALPKLQTLDLSFNQFGGAIPEGIANGCRNLRHVDFSANLLVGGIPVNLGNCSEIRNLLLSSNLLDGGVPAELGKLRKMRTLDVSRNSLSGVVPAELGSCLELSVIVLSNIGSELGLSYSGIDEFNYFQGGIPENVSGLPKLRVVWAPRAMLEGELPRNWGESLKMVNLGENLFTGEIPELFGECEFLNLSSNKLTGWVSEEIPVPCMDVFDVSGNQLSGVIPKFAQKSCRSSHFVMDDDDLSSVYYERFRYSALAGISLPCFESREHSAIYHNFGRNNFTGTVPLFPIADEKSGMETVYAFLVDGNQLFGPLLGSVFEKCKDLKGLIANFSNNLISRGIPGEIGDVCKGLLVFDAAGNRITGVLPESFGLLESLEGLDLGRNRLQGEIPVSFGNVKGLKYLSLSNNNLSGNIPNVLAQLHSLKLLDLSTNSLSGEIPSGLVHLKNLTALFLDRNKLSGKIPSGFANVSSLSLFNVSFNNLSGPLPLNANVMRCDSILGNPLLQSCRVFSLSSPPSDQQGFSGNAQTYDDTPTGSPPISTSSNSGFSSIEIASISSASAIVSVLLALIVLYIYTRKCAPRSRVQSPGRREVTVFQDIGVPITYECVVRATGSFNASNCIGSGGFGATYKAEISPGVLVAIKRLSVGRFQGVQQFHAEIKTLGRWRHPNLVTLIGYHVSESEMFLIYNYLPGGNLERFIQERSKRGVDWRMLHKIALDIARALAYLHDHCVPRILHRDVKPSNILLDNDFNAYLSDFGLARLLGNSETHATTGVAGTFGYVAPEYAMTCRVSDKADVYSYGVVLLELISDKKALDPSFSPYGNGFNIVAWACMLLRQGRAREFFTEGLWDAGPHDDLVESLHLAVMCTVDSLSIRPTMKQVVQRLKQLQPPTC